MSEQSPSHQLSLGSYNILNPFHAVKWRTDEGLNEQGEDNWDIGRAQTLLENLNRAPLELCALQELSSRTYAQLAEAQLHGKSCELSTLYTHSSATHEGAHGVAVLYHPDRFKKIRDVALKTPEIDYRCAACVDLESREHGDRYRIISVHLKGYNPYEENIAEKRRAQVRGDRELTHYIEQGLSDLEGIQGVFILGDFNEDAEEMKARGVESRQGRLIELGFSWSGTSEVTEVRSGRQIDWILYRDLRKGERQLQTRLDALTLEQVVSASDHKLIGLMLTSIRERD